MNFPICLLVTKPPLKNYPLRHFRTFGNQRFAGQKSGIFSTMDSKHWATESTLDNPPLRAAIFEKGRGQSHPLGHKTSAVGSRYTFRAGKSLLAPKREKWWGKHRQLPPPLVTVTCCLHLRGVKCFSVEESSRGERGCQPLRSQRGCVFTQSPCRSSGVAPTHPARAAAPAPRRSSDGPAEGWQPPDWHKQIKTRINYKF